MSWACRRSATGSLALLASVVACGDDSANEGDAGGQCLGEPTPYADSELIEWFGFGVDFDEFCAAGVESSHDHARWVAQAWGREPEPFHYGVFESVEGAESAGDIRLALLDADTGGLSGENYAIAARFVAFLLETRGIDQLRALCELGARDAAQFELDVIETYGESFEDLATEFDTYPEWSVSELRQDQACESSDILVQPAEWDFHFSCEEPGVEGKLGRWFETQRLVELPEERMYVFRFESDRDLELLVELRNCSRDGMASIFFSYDILHYHVGSPGGILSTSPYPAGVYVVRVRVADPTEPVDLHVSVMPWP